MTDTEKKYIQQVVDNKGLEYAVRYYDTFEEISDPEFHRLRRELVESIKKFESYVGVST